MRKKGLFILLFSLVTSTHLMAEDRVLKVSNKSQKAVVVVTKGELHPGEGLQIKASGTICTATILKVKKQKALVSFKGCPVTVTAGALVSRLPKSERKRVKKRRSKREKHFELQMDYSMGQVEGEVEIREEGVGKVINGDQELTGLSGTLSAYRSEKRELGIMALMSSTKSILPSKLILTGLPTISSEVTNVTKYRDIIAIASPYYRNFPLRPYLSYGQSDVTSKTTLEGVNEIEESKSKHRTLTYGLRWDFDEERKDSFLQLTLSETNPRDPEEEKSKMMLALLRKELTRPGTFWELHYSYDLEEYNQEKNRLFYAQWKFHPYLFSKLTHKKTALSEEFNNSKVDLWLLTAGMHVYF